MSDERIRQILSRQDITAHFDAPLSKYTGFRTGGSADYMAEPSGKPALIRLMSELREASIRFIVLGNGSNVLAPDAGYRGVVVRIRRGLSEMVFPGKSAAYAEAGALLSDFCARCAEEGLAGLEFAYGIPGTVGGAVYMNAGAYGGEMKDIVSRVECLDPDGNVMTLSADEMAFAYRTSAAQRQNLILLGAWFALSPGDPDEIAERMQDVLARRREKQPLELPSCGSTFKRPADGYASQLIDECGLRGLRLGGAQVSEKHCGFIVNTGGATSAEILALVEEVRRVVFDKKKVLLECEIRIMEP